MQIYSITSGKGGVGKTSIVCSMATRLGQLGKRVLLMDADMGLANVDIMLNLKPQATLAELFRGEAELPDLLVDGPPGVTILPSASGVQALTHLSDEQILQLMSGLDELDREFDILFVDTGAGIGKNVLWFNAAARDVIVVATPEPTSMVDAYAIMKVLARDHGVKRFNLVVNQVTDRKEALRVYRHLTNVADQHLDGVDISIDYLGHVVRDPHVSKAVIERRPLVESFPDSDAATCVRELVDRLLEDTDSRPAGGNVQFFWRRLMRPNVP